MERDHSSALEATAGTWLFTERRARPRIEQADVPPLLRGSMVASPWYGLRAALQRALGRPSRAVPRFDDSPPQAWQRAARSRRQALLALVVLTAGLSGVAMQTALDWQGAPLLSALQLLLFLPLMAWVAAGFWSAVMGFVVLLTGDRHMISTRMGDAPIAPEARTAIVMPICNEHVPSVMAGLRATCESLCATGVQQRFELFVLSDTRDPVLQDEERAAWQRLRAHFQDTGLRIHYRVRRRPGKRKAGNIADFCRRWGRLFRYMIVLDADSIMSGECLTGMVRLMERNPRAGIIQTVPRPCGQSSLHARAQQFAARVAGSVFTAGMQFWQLGDSHYWGHNAILRIEPFMRHCALAQLEGSGPLSGDVMSHDFVEAALIRRAGYHVWVVDLPGSYEQVPHNLLEELQRDRRWCKGNLLNTRLIAEPGIVGAHRWMFAAGALSYASAPLWLAYLLLGTLAWSFADPADAPPMLLPALCVFTFAMLLLPRALGVLACRLRGEQKQYGGTSRLLGSALIEALLSVVQAPVRMFAHTSFVFAALTGVKLEWTSPSREAHQLAWSEATTGFIGHSLLALEWAMVAALSHPAAALWLAPVYLPLLCAVPLAVFTGDLRFGLRLRQRGLLLAPEETTTPQVLRKALHYAGQPMASRRDRSPPPMLAAA